jgi:hypothetical protein
MSGTYLCCALLHSNQASKVYLLHKILKFAPTLDVYGTPWDNILFAFLCCALLHSNQASKVYLLHMILKLTHTLDGYVTPWDNIYYLLSSATL